MVIKVTISKDGVWVGDGAWTNDSEIVDCSAVLGADQDASDETYEALCEALAGLPQDKDHWRGPVDVIRPDGIYTAELIRVIPSNGKRANRTAFIAVFRPHQRRAWAQAFESQQEFIDAWANGYFDSSCHANGDLEESDCDRNFQNAWADVGHDLHALTHLGSAEEVARYLEGCDYYGRHNKAAGEVEQRARELGWIY